MSAVTRRAATGATGEPESTARPTTRRDGESPQRRRRGAPTSTVRNLRIALWPRRRVKPYPQNPRAHSEDEVRRLAEFIESVGFLKPIEVDEAGVVLAGHRRLLAAKLLGLAKVPVLQHRHLDETQKRAYRVADNRLTLEGEWHPGFLKREMRYLRGKGWDLKALAFSDSEVRRILDSLPTTEDAKTEPEAPEPLAHAVTREGDIWTMGEHRLMCCDALKPGNLDALLGKSRAAAVFTDPPYAIYGSSTGIASDITDDKMVRPFFREILEVCVAACRPFAHVYVCCDWRSYPSWWEVAKGTGIFPKNMVVWDKGGSGLGANYANTHELLFFAWLIPLRRNMSQKLSGGRQVNDANVWRVNRVPAARKTGGREHNAQKPVALVRRALENSTEAGDLVLDFFMGSGTTIVAAQETGRRCYGFEIDPRYCDVSVLRWQRAAKLKAKLAATGQTFDQVAAERAKARPQAGAGRRER